VGQVQGAEVGAAAELVACERNNNKLAKNVFSGLAEIYLAVYEVHCEMWKYIIMCVTCKRNTCICDATLSALTLELQVYSSW
jgi:hypothetical protein